MSLVEQMYKDFEEYGWDVESFCHRIYSGKEKESKAPVVITSRSDEAESRLASIAAAVVALDER